MGKGIGGIGDTRRAAAKHGIKAIDAFLFLSELLGDDAPSWLKDYMVRREKRRGEVK